MENFNFGWGITIFLILMFMAALFIVAWIFVEYGKMCSDRATEYAKKYARINTLIEKAVICEQNHDWLKNMISHLKGLKYKNSEKTEVLENKFREKFIDWVKANKEVV